MKAVLAGGGVPHRLGLSDSVLVYAQHRALLGDDPVPAMVALARRLPERHVTIEVDSVAEAAALRWPLRDAEALPAVVHLDKGLPRDVRALRIVLEELTRPDVGERPSSPGRVVLAAAGGVTAENAAAYTEAGADVLVTSAPYYGSPFDVAVRIIPS